jgi:hypothetical protein
MAKITRKSVVEAHNAYGAQLAKWGESNQATLNAMVRYWELRRAFEAQGGTYR